MKDALLDQLKIDSDFFVFNTLDVAINRPTKYEYIGKIKNPNNQDISFDVFKDRLKNNENIRNEFYGI